MATREVADTRTLNRTLFILFLGVVRVHPYTWRFGIVAIYQGEPKATSRRRIEDCS